jgi:hypothetical protein
MAGADACEIKCQAHGPARAPLTSTVRRQGLHVAVGIEHPSVLDLVTMSKSGEEVALVMVAAAPWTEEEVLALQAKTQSYLSYIESGALGRDYPSAVGKRVRLQLDTTHALSEMAQRFVSLANAEWCEPAGISFVVVNV